jgi:hypothetical protein
VEFSVAPRLENAAVAASADCVHRNKKIPQKSCRHVCGILYRSGIKSGPSPAFVFTRFLVLRLLPGTTNGLW